MAKYYDEYDFDPNDVRYDDAREKPRRRRHYGCSDRMCGADDCERCHPENFRDGEYDGEEEE